MNKSVFYFCHSFGKAVSCFLRANFYIKPLVKSAAILNFVFSFFENLQMLLSMLFSFFYILKY